MQKNGSIIINELRLLKEKVEGLEQKLSANDKRLENLENFLETSRV